MNDGNGKGAHGIWTISNVITIVRILLVPLFAAVLLCPWPEWLSLPAFDETWKRGIAAGVFVVISGTDWLDGYLARRLGQVTNFGKFMDPLADKILVAAALIALVELDAMPTWVVLVILAREFIVSGVRMMAAAEGVVIAASWLGKFKTVFQMAAIVLFTIKGFRPYATFAEACGDPLWVVSWVVMTIALALTVASLIDYLFKARYVIGLAQPSAEELVLLETQRELVDVATDVISILSEQGETLCTAESLTGGMIGAALTVVPGASDVFKGGIVSYVNDVKRNVLSVSADVLDRQGPVSEECACQMAEGARAALGSSIAVSATGIAGPSGAEPGKPVGTVYIGVASRRATFAKRFVFEGTRDEVRGQTVQSALSLVVDELAQLA